MDILMLIGMVTLLIERPLMGAALNWVGISAWAMISWMSWKHKFISLSTTEAEYIAASMANCEAVWLRKLFGELFEQVTDTTIIYCDNKSVIRFTKNLVFHDKSKHIEIKYDYI